MLKKILSCTAALGLIIGASDAFSSADDPAAQSAPTAEEQKKVKEFKDALGSLNIDIKKIKPDTIVARVNKKTFTAEDVAAAMQQTLRAAQQSMGPDFVKTLTPEVLFLIALEQLIDLELINQEVAANKKRLEAEPEVQEKLAEAAAAVLQAAFVKEKADEYVTKARMKEKYEEFSKKFPKDAEESHLRMIVVKTEDDAKKIIDQLNGGADFLKLARENSIDKKTAENDGDLGYVNEIAKGSLLPGFDVVFEKKDGKYAIAAGGYTKTAIKAPLGYVILKVEDRRPIKKPKLSELEPALKEMLHQEAVQKMQEGLKNKKDVKIERLHPNTGKPMESLETQLKGIQEKLMPNGKDAKAADAKAPEAKKEDKPADKK
jgi:peptidyl-prolyl cis-trans isomerase C